MQRSEEKKQESVFVSGMFNVLHPGHFRFLKYAASLGGKLSVGVLCDRLAPLATVAQGERLQNMRELAFIDEVFLLEVLPEKYIAKARPDFVVKGWEYHDQDNPEIEVLESYGGRLVFSSGEINLTGFSAPEENSKGILKTIVKPQKFMERHDFNFLSLKKVVKKFDALNVCVLGDIIVDEYVTCQAVGMSREDPTIVVRPADCEFYLGGAGIVSAHACGLGAQVHFLSVSGDDDAGRFAEEKLREYGVNAHIFVDDSRPTTQKKRYRANNKTMLRVNDYSDHPVSEKVQNYIMERLQHILHDLDVIIFSDFSYGVLPQKMVDDIIKLANDNDIIVAADSQTSSQTGNIARFKNASLITPTEHEVRTAIKNFADGLVKLSDKICDMTAASNIVITLAEEGLFVSRQGESEIVNDRLPAFQATAVDPAGAGDAFLVASAMGLAAGASIWEAVYLGSLASGVQVSRIGNIPLGYQELMEVLLS